MEISVPEPGSRSFKGIDFLSFLLGGLFITIQELLPRVANFRDLARDIVEGVRELS